MHTLCVIVASPAAFAADTAIMIARRPAPTKTSVRAVIMAKTGK